MKTRFTNVKHGCQLPVKIRALGHLPIGTMNKTETVYAAYLEEQMVAGGVLWWKFEGMKFRLADNTFYTPDFIVMRANRELEAHEIKGFWHDDARVKIKVAASLYPMKFIAVKITSAKAGRDKWVVEEF